jgi:D-alanine transaminase
MEEGLAWLNGQVGLLSEMEVPVNERGFLFADGIYEVIRVYNSRPFLFEEHMRRLARSAAAILLELPFPPERLAGIARELIDQSRLRDAEIYLQVTRGVAPRGLGFPSTAQPTVLLAVKSPRALLLGMREHGVSMATVPDDRWLHCDIKSIALLPNVLALERAHRAGADEALLVRDGFISEGASSNFFLVRQGILVTPVADWRILPGVTRAFVLQLAREGGIPAEERDIPGEELTQAEEAFITSTFREILPVTSIDGRPVGNGLPGPLTRSLYAAYQAVLPTGS